MGYLRMNQRHPQSRHTPHGGSEKPTVKKVSGHNPLTLVLPWDIWRVGLPHPSQPRFDTGAGDLTAPAPAVRDPMLAEALTLTLTLTL